ncbi:MAG: hypothetical protein NWR73_05290 [Flavobacteriales bacterium]|nr:hypothetical protein [Flavobacteriales bacterium]
MTKSTIIFTFLLFTATIFSCGNAKKQHDSTDIKEFNIKSITSQDVYPGVHSNLRKTRNYKLVMSAKMHDEHKFIALLVDSVQLPIEFIRADGSAITSEGYGFQGQFDELVISVSRHFYQQYAPDMVAEVISELSGFQLGDSAQLMISGPLGVEYIDLGIVQRQDNIYAP